MLYRADFLHVSLVEGPKVLVEKGEDGWLGVEEVGLVQLPHLEDRKVLGSRKISLKDQNFKRLKDSKFQRPPVEICI